MAEYTPAPKNTGDQLSGPEWTAASTELDEQETHDAEQDAAIAVLAPAGNIYDTNDHGLVGDWAGGDANSGSGTNDTSALNALIALAPAGSTIVFDGSKTYRLDGLDPITKALTFDFSGASIVTKVQSAGNLNTAKPLIHFESQIGAEISLASGALTRNTVSVTTATAADAGLFAAGDLVLIYGSQQVTKWDTGSVVSGAYLTEIVSVESVNASTGVVTLADALRHDHSGTAALKIRKVTSPVVRPVVRNVGLVIDTDPGSASNVLAGGYAGAFQTGARVQPNIFSAWGCIDPLFENINGRGWQGFLTYFECCLRPRITDVEGSDAFRPTVGGHGYINRMAWSHDGVSERSVGIRIRHVADYVGGSNCGSRFSFGYDHQGAYITHGHGARDTFSYFDTALSGDPSGWALGDPEYNTDYGFDIVHPTYYGTGRAIRSWSQSTGLKVSLPNIHTSSDTAILITQLSGTSVIDASNGIIEATGASPIAVGAVDTTSGIGTQKPVDVTILGGPNAFIGSVTLSISGKATLRDVPAANLGSVVAGTVDNADVSTKTSGPASSTGTAVPTFTDTTGKNLSDNPNVSINSSGHLSARAYRTQTTSTTTSGGTLTLSVTSPQVNLFTGSSNHTLQLPGSGTQQGEPYTVINNSTGIITVNSSGGNFVGSVPAGAIGVVWCLANGPANASHWKSVIYAAQVAVPATATSTGVPGTWAADASWFYVCTAANTWRRAAVASW